MIERLSVLFRLHPIEVISPLVFALTLSLLCVPNYLAFAPNMELKETVVAMFQRLEWARDLSSGEGGSEVLCFPEKSPPGCVFRFTGRDRSKIEFPKRVSFGRDDNVPPLPGPILRDGQEIYESPSGITFEGGRVEFRNGSVKGFPGVIYLHNTQGENVALKIPTYGGVRIWEWNGRDWIRGKRWLQ